ncbi:MAG: site-specific DNA-methyltransferase, partial [Clostridia bacterium]|nr:site-specific DNA-methyltransferase [Clostridia bacterium]
TGEKKGQKYRTMGLYQASLTLERSSNARYWIECPDGSKCIPPEGKRWRVIESSYREMLKNGDIEFIETTQSPLFDQDGKQSQWNIYTKIWLNDRLEEGQKPSNFISSFENRHSAKELNELNIPFDFAKFSGLIKHLIKTIDAPKDITILDFFSGSATTAHAVMQLNAEDGGNRKFIMVQLPEECDEKSEAYKAGYKTICEIGEERIRRAGLKIVLDLMPELQGEGSDYHISLMNNILSAKDPFDYVVKNGLLDEVLEEFKGYQDVGFRVLKLDSSNMQDVYYNPNAMRQSLLDETIDNVKSDRTPLDLLFQIMLDLGVELSAKIEEKQVNGKTYFVVNGNDLIACFDEDIDNDVITEIAKQQPLYAVFKSTSFATDSASINNEQLFKTYSPATVIKVI